MQWLQLVFWVGSTLWFGRDARLARIWGHVICGMLVISMGMQLWLLWEVGKLNVQTGMPLHLCGMMALLSVPMVHYRSQGLFAFSLLLGIPFAGLALFFPAIAQSARPTLMALSFFRLHILILCAPLLLLCTGFSPKINPRPVLLHATGYMAFVSLFNRIFNTNYLFLRLAPAGTPLKWLEALGTLGYVVSLEMFAMVLLTGLCWLYPRLSDLRRQEKNPRANPV